MAVAEASEGRAVPTAARVLQLCYSYDRGARRYYLDLTRLAGIVTLAAVAVIGAVLLVRGARHPKPEAGR